MHSSSFRSRACQLTQECTSDDFTHVDIVTNIRYLVSSEKVPLFYELIANCIKEGQTVGIAERLRSTSPILVSFVINREEFTASDVSSLHTVVTNLIQKKAVIVEETIHSIAYWNYGRLYIRYFCMGITNNNLLLIERHLVKKLEETGWSKRFASIIAEPIIPLFLDDARSVVSFYTTNLVTNVTVPVSVGSIFQIIARGLLKNKIISEYDVYRRGEEDLLYLVLSANEISVPKKDLPERRIVELRPRFDEDEFSCRDKVELDYENEDKIDIPLILRMWKLERFASISEWEAIGQASYHYYKGRTEGMDLWYNESMKIVARHREAGLAVPLYLIKDVREQIEIKYYTYRHDKVDAKTLCWVAREDSPDAFAAWEMQWRKIPYLDAISCNIGDVARAFYKRFFLDLIYEPSGRTFIGYYFDESRHRLIVDPSGSEIFKRTMWRFRNDFRRLRSTIDRMIQDIESEGDDDNEIISSHEKISGLKKVVAKLERLDSNLATPFADQVIRASARYFCSPNLSSYLNMNQDLLCAKTGVIVATRRDICVRPGRPQDYLTTEIDAHFVTLDWSHPIVVAIMWWAKQTFIKKDLIQYWFMFIASLLRGGNPDKIVPVIYGPLSNNSKSAWIRAIQKVLGNKCIKGTMGILTIEERNPHGPTSLLVDFSEARLVLCEEAEEGGRPIRAGFLKNISGSDTYYAARKFKDGVQLTPAFILGIVTNSIPATSTGDAAMRQRFVVIEIITTRVPADMCAATIEEQFKKRVFVADPYFEDTTTGFGEGLLWIAYEYYPIYLKKGLVNKPPAIKASTDRYWQEKDMYVQFRDERIEITTNQNDCMTVSEVQDIFNDWYNDAYPKKAPPSRPKFLEEMKRLWDCPIDSKWRFVKPKVLQQYRTGGTSQPGGFVFGAVANNFNNLYGNSIPINA